MILLRNAKVGIKLVYINGYKKYYYSKLASPIINYKEQVFITSIKTNI